MVWEDGGGFRWVPMGPFCDGDARGTMPDIAWAFGLGSSWFQDGSIDGSAMVPYGFQAFLQGGRTMVVVFDRSAGSVELAPNPARRSSVLVGPLQAKNVRIPNLFFRIAFR